MAADTYHVVKAVWSRVKRDIGPDERLQIADVDRGPPLFIAEEVDAYRVRAEYFRVDRDGLPIRDSYRRAQVDLSGERLMQESRRGDGAFVDYVRDQLRYLVVTLRPARKPKDLRVLQRRTVIAPAPKYRRRLK